MLPKFLIGIGVFIIILGLLAVPIGIHVSFANMENAEIKGISGVTTGITTALLGSLSSIAGGILLAIGAILFNKRKEIHLLEMKFTVLGSGSTGNAVLITAGKTKVLVDAGLSAKEITRRIAEVGEDIATLDAILITHEHSDHVGGLRVLMKSVSCPIYMSGATLEAYLFEKRAVKPDEGVKRTDAIKGKIVEIESSYNFCIGEIDFEPFTVPHDAADNFGFVARHAGIKIAALTDFGHITTLIAEKMRGCEAILIESNHSLAMLKTCTVYSWDLKQRISSRTGHLSNEDLALWLTNEFDGAARHIVLTHLSQRANEPHLVRLTAESALRLRSPLFKAETRITLSHHKNPTDWIEF